MNEVTIIPSNGWLLANYSIILNQTSSPPSQDLQPTERATFIGAIFAFVFILVGLIGNVLLITTILSVKKLRTNIINIFIVSVRSTRHMLNFRLPVGVK